MTKQAYIYIIYGASGSGKTTLLNELEFLNPSITIHKKGTTRGFRDYDGNEIKLEENLDPRIYDYIYSNYGYEYGIQKKQIDNSIKEGKHHFIICNDKQTVQKIKNDYQGIVRVIYLTFDMPEKILKEIQEERKISDDEINVRLKKIEILNQDFLKDRTFFDGIILNKFGSPPSRMLTQLKSLVESDSNSVYASDIMDVKVELALLHEILNQINNNTQPQNKIIDTSEDKNFAFVIMAMSEDDPLLMDVHESIKRACKETGFNAQRVDDKYHGTEIPQKILNNIKIASIIIADLTHEKPNTYYELGYAKAYEKKIIILSRKGTTVHFDVNPIERIIYENTTKLEQRLTAVLNELKG